MGQVRIEMKAPEDKEWYTLGVLPEEEAEETLRGLNYIKGLFKREDVFRVVPEGEEVAVDIQD